MLVEVHKVKKSFELGEHIVQALRTIDLKIDSGGIQALMGPSGSGKSTLLNTIGTLDFVTSGHIIFQGQNISEFNLEEKSQFRNTKVGFIFQNFNLIPVLTTIENVMIPFELAVNSSMTYKQAKSRAEELLEKVGLKDQINQSVNKLSGGQMQRVSIARALINQPTLILADEPTANLDGETTKEVMSVLRDQCKQEGSTALIATHDLTILEYCDRIIKMKDGEIYSDTAKDPAFNKKII